MLSQDMKITLPHWDAHAIAGEPLSSIVSDLRNHRARGALGDLMMDSVTLADIYEDCDQLVALDAILVPFNAINRKMKAMSDAMKRTGLDVPPVKYEVSEPFTQRGSAQVAVIFSLSDGQTITVFFHNPDTTPKRIKATDEMVSWRWLLNKKDVTIVVAAEHGQDVKVQDVARRVMKLAQKNSTAFKRLNAKKSEREAVIQGLKDEVTTLEATLQQEREKLEAAKAEGSAVKEPDPASTAVVEDEMPIGAPQTEDDGLSDDPNAPNYRYADTGHIAGARKFDVTEAFREAVKNGQLVRWRDLDWEGVEENPRRAKELIVKSNLFGKVDWPALREGGMDPGAAFLMDRVFASIASEPTEDSPEARKDYARGIESVRERLETCKTADEVVATLHEMYDEKRGIMLDAQESADYQAAEEEVERTRPSKHPLVIEHKRLTYEAQKAQNEMWAIVAEIRKSRKKENPDLEAAKVKAELAYRAASDASIAFVEQNPALKSIKRDLGNGRFVFENDIEHAYRLANAKARLILDINMARNLASNPTTRAWNALGDRFASVLNGKSEAFAGHRAAVRMGKVKDWSWAEKEGATKSPTKRAARFQLQVADSYERIGGREVKVASTAELKDRFGLRDVQSGNWVLKDPESAQWHVQHAAEAMTDLADLLGVDSEKLAVGGRVALAFGARGKGNAGFGGGAAAHYEPVERVINITKMRGGGSLAHEWFHALDNLIPESMGLNAGSGSMVTEDAAVRAALPPQVAKAIEGLVSAMRQGDQQGRMNMTITQVMRDTAAFHAKNAWKYGADLIINQVFNAKGLDEAFAAIKAKEDALKASKARRGAKFTAKDSAVYNGWREVAAAHFTPADQAVAAVPVGEKMSSFALEASNLDAGGSKPYWSKTLELSARAFQAYVEDRLGEKGQKNSYLSAKADNKFYHDPIFGDTKPFPEGEERERINKAFDNLFESLRGTGVLDSVFAMM